MKKLFGDRAFYRTTLGIVIPVIIQNGISNFIGLLDNIMVGRVGTEQMSGVSIANTLIFIFNLCIFGAVSGAGIFSAQFYGSGDNDGVRNTTLFKVISTTILTAICIGIFIAFGEPLIAFYLKDDVAGSATATLAYGKEYLMIMLVGLLPFALTQAYASTLRETGETVLPMTAGIISMFVNLTLNYVLIFGKLGAPVMGVAGAAIATVISRFVELGIVAIVAHARRKAHPFLVGLYTRAKLPLRLVSDIIKKGMPLMVNEVLWSCGIAMLTQCYSTRGLSVVAALNITNTVANFFNVVFFSMGNAIAIIVGQQLGANKFDEAKGSAVKLTTLGVISSAVTAVAMSLLAPYFPLIYNTSEQVRDLATSLLLCCALMMPIRSFAHCCYFTLRSGGKTLITFLFDSAFMWLIVVPIAFLLSRYTALTIIALYLICESLEFIKCIVGSIMVKTGIWINNLVDNQKEVVPVEQ
ncbi:MAG: MATE family efflux transporter [Ruminococcaceae bacterium]|nr:MATE family efflux transporter [Oscillospiraceae bacterium]